VTRARSAALEALERADGPLCAAEVLAAIGAACDQATVYRALHFLEDQGMAESFVLHCEDRGTERYYVSRNAPHRHWLHCGRCHRFTDLGECAIGPLVSRLERSRGVKIAAHVMYFTGVCERCAKKASPAARGPRFS
jgi:Fur family transcriptional regulator, ferric uptake regulator